jgi:hypothetical protein
MLRVLSRVAALVALSIWLMPALAAQSASQETSDRVIAIVHLRATGAPLSDIVGSLADGAGDGGGATERDRRRALRDAQTAARFAASSRAGRARIERTIAQRGGRVLYSLTAVNAIVADVSAGEIEALRRRPDVASVVVDEPRQAHLDVATQALLVPTFWNSGYSGGAVDVGVIDTGLYVEHNAFVSRSSAVVHGVFHQTAQLMSNYWDVPTDPDDYAGHGTFVSGVVFSQGEAANPARRGMAPGLDRLYNIKAGYLTYPSGGSSLLSDLMAGVDWALLSADPPEVFNYSYGARVSTDDDIYTQFWDGVVDAYGKTATIS